MVRRSNVPVLNAYGTVLQTGRPSHTVVRTKLLNRRTVQCGARYGSLRPFYLYQCRSFISGSIRRSHSWTVRFRFIYTDDLMLTNENVLPLFFLADKYAVLSLRAKIVDFFKSTLEPSAALAMLIGVSCYPELREMCVFET